MRNINVIDLSGRKEALSKAEFFEGTRKVPFVYDLLRAETLWQDRKLSESKGSQVRPASKINFLTMKRKLLPKLTVFVHVNDKILVFMFEQKNLSNLGVQRHT